MKYRQLKKMLISGRSKDICISVDTFVLPESDNEVRVFSLNDLDTLLNSYSLEDKFSSCFIIDNYLIIKEDKSTSILQLDGKINKVYSRLAAPNLHCGKMIFLTERFKGKKGVSAVLCDNPDKVIWSTTVRFGQYYICDQGMLLASGYLQKNIILGLDVQSGEVIWKIDLRGYKESLNLKSAECNGFLGVYEDLLFLSLAKNGGIISQKIENGDIINLWSVLPNITYGPHKDNTLPNPTQSVLHKEAGRIIGIARYYYWEIDLGTRAVSFQDLTDTFKAMEIDASGKPAYQGDYLFFTSDALYEEAGQSIKHSIKIVAFNWRTREVEWEHDFGHPGEGFYQVKPPVVGNDYLFTVDTKGSLHIFQKDKLNLSNKKS